LQRRGLRGPAAPAIAQTPGGRLVLYTSQPDTDAQQTVDAFRQKHPGVDVQWTRGGTTEVLNRLRAEIQAGRRAAEDVPEGLRRYLDSGFPAPKRIGRAVRRIRTRDLEAWLA
jgi:hypothetical protein